jgi:ATP-dependent Clp endopeptidase proteolytic subunit ClpP
MARINRDDVDKLYDYDLYIPSRTIYMGSCSTDDDGNDSGVDTIMAERVIKALHLLDQKEEPITIIMNNPGGDWLHGMAIFDAIKECKSHVTIKVKGMAMSMGAVILQAADHRIMSPNSRFMMHYGYMGMGNTHAKIFEKWADESKRINSEMEQIFLQKIKSVKPNFTLDDLKKLLDYDTILTAQETVDYGLADEVL